MQEIINESLSRSFSYIEYREAISKSLEGKKAEGTPAEDMVHYTLLNETRMNRLEKTILLSEEVKTSLSNLNRPVTWLVLSEGWCGDAAQILPILNKMADASDNIKMRVVFRDENEPLMNLFLTNGSKSIPKLIILDPESNRVLADWGPRPKGASDLIKRYKVEFGAINEEAINQLQLWYLHDKGESTQNEIVELMKQVG
ncbi:MAG TPA: thioredoxin family protein [Flavobacterium sp.]|jgi:hypothetical protein